MQTYMKQASIIALVTILGCDSPNLSIHDAQQRFGKPDLIVEVAGDMGRTYEPRTSIEYAWPRASRVLYYLNANKKVIIENGRVQEQAIQQPERVFVLDKIEQLRSAANKARLKGT